jgi:hypothetical protein
MGPTGPLILLIMPRFTDDQIKQMKLDSDREYKEIRDREARYIIAAAELYLSEPTDAKWENLKFTVRSING